jgi:hypothetical protein
MAVVARFRDLPGAEVASATLDAAGISNSLRDTFTIGVLWSYSIALGWIRLSVSDSDLDEALRVLTPDEVAEWPAFESGEGDAERCPACDSDELAVESGARKTLALMLLFPVPIWFWRSRLVCRRCGASWRIPLKLRPEIVLVWLISALVAVVATAAVTFTAMTIIRGGR